MAQVEVFEDVVSQQMAHEAGGVAADAELAAAVDATFQESLGDVDQAFAEGTLKLPEGITDAEQRMDKFQAGTDISKLHS